MSIASLKRKARALLLEYEERLDRFDCGRALAEQIDTKMHALRENFNQTMDELARIDPKCPKRRL